MTNADRKRVCASAKRDALKRPPPAALDRTGGTSLYRQICLVLHSQLRDGVYREGDLLPGEQELMAEYGVSRITARRALNELAQDGLATRIQGKGTFASAPRPNTPMRASFDGLLENLLMMGSSTDVRVLSFDYAPAGRPAAEALEIELGAEVQRAVRVRTHQGLPISHLTTCVPADIGRRYTRRDLAKTPLLSLLERADVTVASADQTISATLADPATACDLTVEIGAPLTSISRVVRDDRGRAVEWLEALYPAERFQHRMRLSLNRDGGDGRWEPV